MICREGAAALVAARHQAAFMPLACKHTTAPTGHCASVTAVSRSLRARPPWPTHSAELIAWKPSLVVECASHEAVRTSVPRLLRGGNDVVVVSMVPSGFAPDPERRHRSALM